MGNGDPLKGVSQSMELRGEIWPPPLTCISQGDHITQGREKPEALGPPTFQGWKEKGEPPEETQEV